MATASVSVTIIYGSEDLSSNSLFILAGFVDVRQRSVYV